MKKERKEIDETIDELSVEVVDRIVEREEGNIIERLGEKIYRKMEDEDYQNQDDDRLATHTYCHVEHKSGTLSFAAPDKIEFTVKEIVMSLLIVFAVQFGIVLFFVMLLFG